MPLTQEQRAALSRRIDGKPHRPGEEPPEDIEAAMTEPPSEPALRAYRDHFEGQPISRAEFVQLVKDHWPTEAAQFTDDEIGDYAAYYMDKTLAHTVKMVGWHMLDRLDKRQRGAPWDDDANGRAAAGLPPGKGTHAARMRARARED